MWILGTIQKTPRRIPVGRVVGECADGVFIHYRVQQRAVERLFERWANVPYAAAGDITEAVDMMLNRFVKNYYTPRRHASLEMFLTERNLFLDVTIRRRRFFGRTVYAQLYALE